MPCSNATASRDSKDTHAASGNKQIQTTYHYANKRNKREQAAQPRPALSAHGTHLAENSYCERRKVGALVVKEKMIISDGYNGTPSGFENVCEDETNTTKPYVLHAEANAITKLARSSNNSEGATLYVTASPCIECAKLIIQAGIKRVIYAEQYRLTDGIDLLRRANIEVTYLNPDDYEHKETK